MKLLNVLLLIGCTSCANWGSLPLLESMPQAKQENCKLNIYLEGAYLPDQITEVCKVSSRDPDLPWSRTRPQLVVARALGLACKCGADGVVVNDYSGSELKLTAFTFPAIEQKMKGTIGIDLLYKIMNCRYRLGTWANDQCTILPERPGRLRPNPRQ